MAKDKMNVQQLINDFNKHFGEEILGFGVHHNEYDVLKFSSPVPNRMMYGGLPRGRCIEFFGDEGSGKTTTALDIVANAQPLFKDEWENERTELKEKGTKSALARLEQIENDGPKKVLYVDVENTLDEAWATTLGVNTDELVVLKPMSQNAEQLLEMVYQFMLTGQIGLVILDSIAAMVSGQAFDTSIEQRTYAGIAMPMTEFSNKAEMACAQTGCTLIGINQMRDALNVTYGPKTKTPGGRAWKFICSVRIQFRKGSMVNELGKEVRKSDTEAAGNLVELSIVKTKVCKPDRRNGAYTLSYDNGVLAEADWLGLGIIMGFINQRGSVFDICDATTGEVIASVKGQKEALTYLSENKELLNSYNKVLQEVG